MNIKAVIFDLGNVLVGLNFDSLFRKFINPDSSYPDFSLDQVMQEDWFRAHSAGEISSAHFYEMVKERYHFDVDYETFSHEWASIFYPYKKMERFVSETREKYKIGLLSDTDPIHWNYLKAHYTFLQIFKKPILSFQINALKPNPVCYTKAAASVNFPPEECLFIDDRIQNVNGAIKAGMQAVQFTGYDDLITYFKTHKL